MGYPIDSMNAVCLWAFPIRNAKRSLNHHAHLHKFSVAHLAEKDKDDGIATEEPVPELAVASCIARANISYILLMNLSLLTALPGLPVASLGFSVHISFTFSKTMLQ